jgi:hypothetical protein
MVGGWRQCGEIERVTERNGGRDLSSMVWSLKRRREELGEGNGYGGVR